MSPDSHTLLGLYSLCRDGLNQQGIHPPIKTKLILISWVLGRNGKIWSCIFCNPLNLITCFAVIPSITGSSLCKSPMTFVSTIPGLQHVRSKIHRTPNYTIYFAQFNQGAEVFAISNPARCRRR